MSAGPIWESAPAALDRARIVESCSCGARFTLRGIASAERLAAIAAGWRATHRCTGKTDDAASRLGFAVMDDPEGER